MDFLGKHWKYINEGNAHIVLQVPETNYVIRLIKEDGSSVDLRTIGNSVDFVNLLMIPLLCINDDHRQEIILIPNDKLQDLIKDISQFRPENRKSKSVLCPYAIKDINLAILSPKCEENFCVEIKPKEGFMSANFKKFAKCYFCLKQFLKLQQNEINSISDYCPLDLFSGDANRMKYALRNLIKNPQNNFKFFVNGSIAFSEISNKNAFETIMKNTPIFGSTYIFIDFLVEILMSSNENVNTILKKSEGISVQETIESTKMNCLEESHLKKDCFLYKLLYLQKLSENFQFDVKQSDDQGYEYVLPLINRIKTENIDLITKTSKEQFLSTLEPKTLALISAIARDCSIMISFTTSYQDGFPTIQIGEHKIPYRVSVTDLEPKPAKTLAKRLKTEKRLIEIYEGYLNSSCN